MADHAWARNVGLAEIHKLYSFPDRLLEHTALSNHLSGVARPVQRFVRVPGSKRLLTSPISKTIPGRFRRRTSAARVARDHRGTACK